MTRNPVNWFEIYVQDIDRAKTFYGTVFATSFREIQSGDLEMWGFESEMERPGASGALVQMPGMPSGGNSTIVYFSSEDCSVETGRVAAAGGRIFKDKFSIGQYGFIALAYDPDGNMFGMHSLR